MGSIRATDLVQFTMFIGSLDIMLMNVVLIRDAIILDTLSIAEGLPTLTTL